ncbi:alcohol dehydrogenase catalytic domain-containing protein [Anaerotruncus massiliensis (ex Togo et al. 2019)]|uniref:alcohol dehydrogenase catalytic domain-containing protein n=1 Tax=Anaerotruncus massiliensis (ex Togo et al. 2019) TaxID=1673720 RepID=UPI0027B96646|nr:alcohol dehydrogenase catalytic domain-containing protein [Anaerotruncus massiliensis (ex Togo et al. 2019)]
MTEMMKALVAYAPHDYRYENFPRPVQPRAGELILKVRGCGVCAGDIKEYNGLPDAWGTGNDDMEIEPPIIPGHEFCGEVVAIGEGVKDYECGDMVVAEQIVPCGECPDCLAGTRWMCSKMQLFGFKQVAHGGFAEYVRIPSKAITYKVPERFSVEQAALIEPYACGMHAAEQAGVRHTDVVAIAGMGAIGLAITNIVRLSLPQRILAIDTNGERLRLAKEFGADAVLNPLEQDVPAEIHRLTGGAGCDVYIDASGFPDSVPQGLVSLKNHGRYVQFGQFPREVTANWNIIGDGKELTVIGSHLSANCYPPVIRGIESGLLRTDGLISHTFRLKDWKEAYELPGKDKTAMKVLIVP